MAAFVKFSRGLKSAYNNLSIKDPNTLYLVYDSVDAVRGSLYLGNKLISGIDSGGSATSLGELSDVSLGGSLADGMILQYNSSTGGGQWEAVPIADALPAGINNDISIEDSLENINNPSEKDIAIINNEAYIYDGSDWIKLTDLALADRITALETKVGHAADSTQGIPATGLYAEVGSLSDALNNVYTKAETDEKIAQAQHLKYQVVADLEAINTGAAESSHTIFLVPRVNSDTNDIYDEYFVVDDSLEKIGTWGVDLNNYVLTDDDRLLTQELKDKLDAINLDTNDNLVITSSLISDLNTLLANSQYIKQVQTGVFEVTLQEGELRLIGIPSELLGDYVTTLTFNNTVGNLSLLNERVSNNSTLVEEINSIKDSLIWKSIPIQE